VESKSVLGNPMFKEKKIRKQKVYIKGKAIEAFLIWMFEKEIFYGQNWLIWWNEKGMQDFLDWSIKKGISYVRE
jgi:hypothetical protein